MLTFSKSNAFFLISMLFAAFCTKLYAAPEPNITVFIHGTLPPFVNHLMHAFESPVGLVKAKDINLAFVHKKLALLLSQEDSIAFPLEHFYIFRWSGKLSVAERQKSAHQLYRALRKLKGKITLICHSHGCNVALNIAPIVLKHKDTNFTIEKLILLAGPVQEVTKHYVRSSIFKSVFSFYSASDIIQVVDPQGLYHNLTTKTNFFSERIWPDALNIVQSHVRFHKNDLWHIDFITEKFLKHLPQALTSLTELQKKDAKNKYGMVIKHGKTNSFTFNLI